MPKKLVFDGFKLKELRLYKGLTIRQLADNLKGKLNKDTIMRLENGYNQPHPYNVKLLADYFGIEIKEFYKIVNKKEKKSKNKD